MVGENKKELYDAASNGDLAPFRKNFIEDQLFFLDDVSFAGSRNLLHIAAIRGQEKIVEEVLSIYPKLARSLDSQQSSPLHIAAAQGNLEITQMLLEKAPEMRWWRDCQGMNPIHIAAVNGHTQILDKLVESDISPAREKVDKGQTVLHLCIKYGKYDVLRHLVGKFDPVFVGTKDEDGETLLHLAVRCNQIQMVEFLVGENKVSKMERNSAGNTAWDLVKDTASPRLKGLLRGSLYLPNQVIEKFGQGMLIVAGFIATLAFNVSVNTPGGVWQERSSHPVGQAVMASNHPRAYNILLLSSASAFMWSLATIASVATAIALENTLSFMIGIFCTYMSVVCIFTSYSTSFVFNSLKARRARWVSFYRDAVLFQVGVLLGTLVLLLFVICIRALLRCPRV